MITDFDTDFLYFSSLLPKIKYFNSFWNQMIKVIKDFKIPVGFIENTRDIWCRDYMPIQISENEYIQFSYFPTYSLYPEFISKITIPSETKILDNIKVTKSKFIVDGGNVVKSSKSVIMTEKVISDNEKYYGYSKNSLLSKLSDLLKVDKVFIIPKQPRDIFGHSDGMVRFYNDNAILVNDFSTELPYWQKKFNNSINKTKLEVIKFPVYFSNEKGIDGVQSAKGIYINYAQLGNIIFFPQFELPENDEIALNKIKILFPEPDFQVIPINCKDISDWGGVLNCITWNIKIKKIVNFNLIKKENPDFEIQKKYVFSKKDFYLSTFDYNLIADCFLKVWNQNRGQLIGDSDLKNMTYRFIESELKENLIPQFYVEKVLDWIIEYLQSIGQYNLDFSTN